VADDLHTWSRGEQRGGDRESVIERVRQSERQGDLAYLLRTGALEHGSPVPQRHHVGRQPSIGRIRSQEDQSRQQDLGLGLEGRAYLNPEHQRNSDMNERHSS
jgi:hypothetical protein